MKSATPMFSFLRRSSATSVMLITASLATVSAAPMDDVSQPPPTDPSAYYTAPADPLAEAAELDALKTMPEVNQGALALPDGAYGDRNTPRADNVLPPSLQTSFNFPTNGKPSPLFGAEPFTQQLLLFEEFGTEKLDPTIPRHP